MSLSHPAKLLPDEIRLRRSLGGELSALAALFVLTLRQNTHGRRIYVLGGLYLLPCALAVLLRCLRDAPPADTLEFALVFNLLPHGLAPLTALLYAAGMIQDEVEEQTLTYLLLRPLPRWALYVTRMLSTVCTTVILVGVATLALYLAIYWGTPELWSVILLARAPRAIAILALAQLSYCALFGLVGLVTRRSLIVGLIYIIFIEGALANIDFIARALTVVFYVRILILRWLALSELDVQRFERDWRLDLDTVPSAGRCVITLVGFAAIVTLLTAARFARQEFRMKTPETG
jgi:ABC-2 type transport system permease protein